MSLHLKVQIQKNSGLYLLAIYFLFSHTNTYKWIFTGPFTARVHKTSPVLSVSGITRNKKTISEPALFHYNIVKNVEEDCNYMYMMKSLTKI